METKAIITQALLQEFWNTETKSSEIFNVFEPFAQQQNTLVSGAKNKTTIQIPLNRNHCKEVEEICNDAEVLIFNFYATALAILLNKYFYVSDIAFISPCIQFQDTDSDEELFLFTSSIDKDNSFKNIFSSNKKTLAHALNNSATYQHISEYIDPQKLQTLQAYTLTLNNSAYTIDEHQSKILFSINTFADNYYLSIAFSDDQYHKKNLEFFGYNFNKLLEEILQHKYDPVKNLNCISFHEEALFKAFNKVEPYFSLDKNIIEHIESKALLQLHKTAMQFNEQLIDYGTLNGVANQLAHYLVEKHSTGKDILIGVMMHRSITMAESILGIWKTGSAYVPLDTDYPVERIQQMVEAGQIKALIVDQTVSVQQIELLQPHIPVIHIDEIRSYLKKLPTHNLNKTIDANDLAYVIYTSGSTGQPKGVMIEHLGMMNHIGAKIVEMQISEDSKLAQNAPHTFDISVWQLFAGLVAGGTTVIYSSEIILDPNRFIQQLHVDGITVLELVPSYFVEMLSVLEEQKDAHLLEELKILILNAETLMPSMVKRWLTLYPNIPIVNTYGATETSDDTSHYIMHSLPDTSTVPVMQKPIQYFEVHLVDEQLQRVPIGAIGEVLLCGIAVGRGYLNDEAKTKKSFLTGPLPGITESKRIYRTGDLARYLSDGRMEFLGRKDTQVKIRGHRIELGEIEHALMEIVEIENTTVLANVEEQYLAAYYQSEKELAREDIIELLKKKLPSYMLPHYYIRMEQFPLSANGKIDKKQLPKPETLGLSTGANYVAPTNETEKHVVAVYEEVLKKKPIGIKDDFFALGGDSIKSIQVVSRLKQRGLSITIRDILTSPVVKDLATKVKTNSRHIAQNIVEGLIPLSPVQQYFFEQHDVDNHHYNQSVLLQSKKTILEKDLKAALDKLVLHHDALRMVYKKIDNVWIQENKGETQGYHLEILDVQDEENFQAHCNRIQSSIDLQHGPLLKIALFKNPEQADRLLIVCHHLIIDGVSWRILLEDLSTLYQQSLLHQLLTLPLKTDSFQYWLQKQIEYANSNTLEKEENYWSTLSKQVIDLLSIDNTQGSNNVHDTAEETFIVDENTTQQLLTQSYKAYQTDINDVLITALTLAVHKTFNIKHIAITLEGHGREQIVEDIDVSRTIGWFTSLYPVVINVQHHDTLIRHAIEVKETLHRIPNKGVGYGILRYLAKKTYTLQPQIIFNYLGNIEASVTNTEGHQMFEFLGEAHGREISINRKRNHILDISGITVDNQLRLSISYSSQQYNTSTIKRLVDAYQQQLTKLIQQLAAEHTTHITPVDLTYKALTIDQVQQLNFNQNLEDVYPASPLQEGLYYHWFTHPDSLAYFDQISYQVQGHLDMDRIEKSYQQLTDRHAILRTYFTQALSDQLLQVVQKKSSNNFSYIDATKHPSFSIDQYKKEDIAKGFDLHTGSQMRLALIKLDSNHYEFIWSFHHILMDGWCVGILIKEFFEIYESLLKDQQPELPKVHPYANYIQWLNTIDQEESYTYWKNYLQDYDTVSSLYPAPLNQPSNYTIQSKTIHTTEAIRQSIKTLCNTLAITENTFIQTAWGIVLSKYNNTNDVVFGSVVSGRPAEIEGIEEMIGLFINTIPIRIQLPEQISVADILKKIQQQSAEATKYHYTQLAEVQSQSELGNRLFDHIMVFENYPVQDMIAQNMRSKQNEEVDMLSSDVFEQTGYPLTLTVHPDEKDIQVRFSYNAALYTEEQIDQAQQHFIRIIETIVHNPQQHINEIDCLGDKEKQQLLVDFNNTEVAYDKDKTIIDLFEEQVIKTPNTIAILFENKTLTYKQLQAQSDFLAMYLQHSFNIKAGDFVALQLERNEWTIISILAVLKLGAAYVPMDPEFPQERINYIINDSQCKLIIDETLLNNYQQTKQTLPDNKIDANALQSNHYCAVIYTSGSTGKPKGVPITHLNLHNRLQWMWSAFPFEKQEVCVAKTSLSFVDHLWEIFGPLLQGIKLVMLTKNAVLNINSFIEALFQQKVSRIVLVPSLLKAILSNEQLCVEKLQALKIWSCSGEALEVELIKQFYQIFPNHTLLNIYGSTEVMADVTVYDTSFQKTTTEIIIGKPIANTTIYILDQYNNLLPIGITGEIGVSGDGVTNGYLNQPTLTQEKFIANPFNSNTKMYKTGDIGRWLPNGNIEYIGRKDHQIKIRGYRVEIGEIETALQKYPAIDKAVVVIKNTAGENELAAYIISQQKLSTSDIRTYLKTILPSYMVPAYFIQLEKLPLTYSGKIDKKNLPDPQTAAIAQTDMAAYVAPKNELQKKLVLAWQAVLGKEKISIHDNFFELGGNSLRAMKLQTLLHKKYELNITIQDIYNKPTVETLSLLQSNSDRIILLHAKNAAAKTNIYFVPPIVGTPIGYKPLAEKLATHYNSYGLQYRGLGEHDELYPSIQAIALDLSEQILLQQTSAECIIVGYSFGAIIAFEMTKILEAKGKNIQLILVDMKPEKHKQHWLTNIGLALQREWFVLQCTYTILRKNLYTKKIRKFLLNNFSLLDHYTFNGKVKANVHAFEALSNNVKTNMHGWQQYTDGNVTVHYIPGKHEQAFSFDNIAIIEKIIKQLNASTLV